MFNKSGEDHFYYFVDFGGSVYIDQNLDFPAPFSKYYTAPEQNNKNKIRTFASDIFSLGKTFEYCYKFVYEEEKIDESIFEFVKLMYQEDHPKRPTLTECFSFFENLSKIQFENFQFNPNKQPLLSDEIDSIRSSVLSNKIDPQIFNN